MKNIGKLIGKGILYGIIIFHLLVIVNLFLGKVSISEYVYGLMMFFIFGFIPFTAIYVLLEVLFGVLKKRWKIAENPIFRIVGSTLVATIVISLIVLICALFYPEPVLETWKSMLFRDGFWILICYAPVVFVVDVVVGLINPRMK